MSTWQKDAKGGKGHIFDAGDYMARVWKQNTIWHVWLRVRGQRSDVIQEFKTKQEAVDFVEGFVII